MVESEVEELSVDIEDPVVESDVDDVMLESVELAVDWSLVALLNNVELEESEE